MLARQDDTAVPLAAHPEGGLVILHTRGTTGLPKGALISHRAMVARTVIAAIPHGCG
jgi:acyl-CoA synthetase (AMP-forming)/AMP-acid ligase II